MFWDLSPYARGRSLYKFLESFSYGFIPVRTGQILKNSKNYVPIDSSPYARGGRTGKTQIAARDRFIPAHTGQTLNPPRKPLRLRSSCSHLKIPWQSQYVSSFWNAFLRITHFGHFRCFFLQKRDARGTSFSICFSDYKILFHLHSSRVLYFTNELSFPVQ